jgi:hypothetical protein
MAEFPGATGLQVRFESRAERDRRGDRIYRIV